MNVFGDMAMTKKVGSILHRQVRFSTLISQLSFSAHAYQLHKAGYEFWVLPQVFVIHMPHPPAPWSDYTRWVMLTIVCCTLTLIILLFFVGSYRSGWRRIGTHSLQQRVTKMRKRMIFYPLNKLLLLLLLWNVGEMIKSFIFQF